MKISWSHKLFFRINRSIGGRPLLDKVMFAAAYWFIYFFAACVLLWALIALPPVLFKNYIKLLLTAGVFSLVTSYVIALVWTHRRPSIEFPEIQQILLPFNTWKSFPSDHTLVSFVVFFITLFIGAPWYIVCVFFCFATLISVSRVYVGVHYPRDIVGGFVLALLYSLLAFWLLSEVTQPLYLFVRELFFAQGG
jgi:undecaprenyl-diphosphatase